MPERCTNPKCDRMIPDRPYSSSYCCQPCLDRDRLVPDTKKGPHPADILHGGRLHSRECEGLPISRDSDEYFKKWCEGEK